MHPNAYKLKKTREHNLMVARTLEFKGISPLSKRTAKADKLTVHRHMAWRTSKPSRGYVKAATCTIDWI